MARVVDAFASKYNYGPSDGTKAQFAKKKIVDYVKFVVRDSEIEEAVALAADNIQSDVNDNLDIS